MISAIQKAELINPIKILARMRGCGRFAMLAIAALAIVFAAGCKDTTTGVPAGSTGNISGMVVDTNGAPVAGAYLNFNFEYTQPVDGVTVDTPSVSRDSAQTVVQFQLAQSGIVTCSLINYVDVKVRTFFSGTMSAGLNSVICTPYDDEGRLLYSDAYYVQVDYNYVPLGTSPILFGTLPQQFSTNPLPFVQTNAKGEFQIPLNRFPLSQQFYTRTVSSSAIDTVSFANTQLLTAFDSTQYGYASVSVVRASTIKIILTRQRF
jgi:hypothetical protein